MSTPDPAAKPTQSSTQRASRCHHARPPTRLTKGHQQALCKHPVAQPASGTASMSAAGPTRPLKTLNDFLPAHSLSACQACNMAQSCGSLLTLPLNFQLEMRPAGAHARQKSNEIFPKRHLANDRPLALLFPRSLSRHARTSSCFAAVVHSDALYCLLSVCCLQRGVEEE